MRGKYQIQDDGAKLTKLALSIKVNDNGKKANLLTANSTHTVVTERDDKEMSTKSGRKQAKGCCGNTARTSITAVLRWSISS